MYPLGHAMIPAGIAYALQQRGRLGSWDLRLVMLGGLLPDMVDKPVAFALLPVQHGHWVGHTLLFALALLALGARWAPALPLGAGALSHGLLDRLWLDEHQAWMWPAMGGFPLGTYADPFSSLLHPWTLFGEAVGAVILALLVARERREGRGLRAFLRSGRRGGSKPRAPGS